MQINPDTAIVSLHLVLEASKNASKILPYEVMAYDGILKPINANEKELTLVQRKSSTTAIRPSGYIC